MPINILRGALSCWQYAITTFRELFHANVLSRVADSSNQNAAHATKYSRDGTKNTISSNESSQEKQAIFGVELTLS